MSYHDGNRKLQAAIISYLTANLATYASAVANALPKIPGGDFENLGRSHILVYVPEMTEEPAYSGTFNATVMVRVATLKDVTISTHQSYCRAVFDLLMERDLPTYLSAITGNKIRINQIVDSRSFEVGVINESMRHDTMTLQMSVYQVYDTVDEVAQTFSDGLPDYVSVRCLVSIDGTDVWTTDGTKLATATLRLTLDDPAIYDAGTNTTTATYRLLFGPTLLDTQTVAIAGNRVVSVLADKSYFIPVWSNVGAIYTLKVGDTTLFQFESA